VIKFDIWIVGSRNGSSWLITQRMERYESIAYPRYFTHVYVPIPLRRIRSSEVAKLETPQWCLHAMIGFKRRPVALLNVGLHFLAVIFNTPSSSLPLSLHCAIMMMRVILLSLTFGIAIAHPEPAKGQSEIPSGDNPSSSSQSDSVTNTIPTIPIGRMGAPLEISQLPKPGQARKFARRFVGCLLKPTDKRKTAGGGKSSGGGDDGPSGFGEHGGGGHSGGIPESSQLHHVPAGFPATEITQAGGTSHAYDPSGNLGASGQDGDRFSDMPNDSGPSIEITCPTDLCTDFQNWTGLIYDSAAERGDACLHGTVESVVGTGECIQQSCNQLGTCCTDNVGPICSCMAQCGTEMGNCLCWAFCNPDCWCCLCKAGSSED
jgi:uncharacterized membrane protein YgcG